MIVQSEDCGYNDIIKGVILIITSFKTHSLLFIGTIKPLKPEISILPI